MGTLFNQVPRLENIDTTRLGVVDMEEFDRKLSELQDYAATYEMPFSDVLAAYKVQSDITLAHDTLFMQIRDWDIKDEQLAGFGEMLEKYVETCPDSRNLMRNTIDRLGEYISDGLESIATALAENK